MNSIDFSGLSQKERLVYTTVFLLMECPSALVREWLKHRGCEVFTATQYRTEIPSVLKGLKLKGWLSTQYGNYFCIEENLLPVLKAMLTYQEIRALINSSLLGSDSHLDWDLSHKIGKIYRQCCVFAILQQDWSKVEECRKRTEERRKKTHLINIEKDVVGSAFRFLFNLNGFYDEFLTFQQDIAWKYLPFALMHALLFGKSPEGLFKFECSRSDTWEVFLVAAFLQNDAGRLERMRSKSSDEARVLCEALQYTLAGKWKEADSKFTRFLNFRLNSFDIDNDPLLAVITMIAMFPASVIKAPSSRIYRWGNYLKDNQCNRSIPVANACLQCFYQLCQHGEVRENCTLETKLPFSYVLMLTLFSILPERTVAEEDLNKGIQIGKELLEQKQIVFGVYLLNCAGTLLPADDPRRAEFAALLAPFSVAPILPMTRKKEMWENILEDLEKIAGKCVPTQKETDSPEGKIYWVLNSRNDTGWGGKKYLKLQKIEPYFSALSKSGIYTKGKLAGLKKMQNGGYDALLSPEELSIKDSIMHYGASYEIDEDAVKYLIHADNVFLDDLEHPVKVVEEKNSIVSKINDKGDTELSLKYYPITFFWSDKIIFLDNSEPEVCRFCRVSARDQLLRFWNEHSRDRSIVIPRKGAEKLADTAAHISQVFPFSGVLAKEAYRNLPSVNAQTELHARIVREEDGVFLIDFFNKPSPEFDWFVRPGKGQETKILGKEGNQFLLQRDLKQESTAFAALLDTLPAVPGAVKKDCNCELDDPEQVLQVLAQLKGSSCIMDWCNTSPLKISQRIEFSSLHLSGGSSAASWFAVGGELKISEEKVLTLQEIFNALDHKVGSFIQLDDNSYLQLTRDLMKKLELLKVSGSMSKGTLNISPAALPMLGNAFDKGLPENLLKQLETVKEAFAKKIRLPSNLNGELRNYQEDGFRYLARLADCRIGCCLADDMGLGKTIQLLALLLREASRGPALVVCPASLCRNWEREAQRFAPSLHTQILPVFDRESVIQKADKGDLLLCSYGIVQSESDLFSAKKWHTVILDEAQAIKNHTAKRSKSTKDLQADIRIASTGTPIENHLLELWSIFDFLNPGLLGGSTVFEQKFCDSGMPRPELKKLVSPLILRRRKGDVLEDLPPKTEITLPVELNEEERGMYEVLRRKAVEELDGQQESRIAILASLTKLRRFCCDPSLSWEGAAEGSKVKRLLEVAEELKTAGHRALIFSQYVDFLEIIRRVFDRAGLTYQYLDGSTVPAKRMKAVDAFQNGEGDFFLISLKAGGVGLNLTAANYVIITDPWWNPAVEDQAADRAHRIGQKDPVTVYRLIAADTVEEKILDLHARKKRVSDDVLSNAESSGITAAELMSLLETN